MAYLKIYLTYILNMVLKFESLPNFFCLYTSKNKNQIYSPVAFMCTEPRPGLSIQQTEVVIAICTKYPNSSTVAHVVTAADDNVAERSQGTERMCSLPLALPASSLNMSSVHRARALSVEKGLFQFSLQGKAGLFIVPVHEYSPISRKLGLCAKG